MTKAALYARVSTDAQQKEGTIESQLVELRRQITAAGQVLVKEYIDETGTPAWCSIDLPSIGCGPM
jgi:DNA invertase Pin-like site-specific DNA recombinase